MYDLVHEGIGLWGKGFGKDRMWNQTKCKLKTEFGVKDYEKEEGKLRELPTSFVRTRIYHPELMLGATGMPSSRA